MASKTFPGYYKNLAAIGTFVSEHARTAGFSDEDVYAVELAVDEAATNIIEHSYGGEGNGDIDCTCNVTEEGIEIVFRDMGSHFDVAKLPQVNVGVPIDQLELRGAGVFLMKKVMDEVIFEFQESKGTVLTMIKKKSG